MFTLEKFGVGKISFDRDDEHLVLSIDLWGMDYAFGDPIIKTLEDLWNKLRMSPTGEPTRSRIKTYSSFGPNVLSVAFTCDTDIDLFAATARELFQEKKNFIDVVQLKKDYAANMAAQEDEGKKAREKADAINNSQKDGQ